MLSIVGAVNIDVIATTLASYRPQDSNPARVTLSVGGVAMNYAHNLRLMGEEVRFLTAFSDDALGQMAAQQCVRLGIDIRSALTVAHSRANMFVGIHNAEGDLESAACDAELTERYVDEAYLAANKDVFAASHLVMADANLSSSALAYLFDWCPVPLMIDGVSVAKTERLVRTLHACAHPHLHTIKLNQAEFDLFRAQLAPLRMEDVTRCVLVTKGAKGVDYYDAADTSTSPVPRSFPAVSVEHVVSTLGAGDAFLSGWAYAYLHQQSLEDAIHTAQLLAARTLSVSGAVCEE